MYEVFLVFFNAPDVMLMSPVRCQTADMRNFYPSTMLETGRDTIFSWVARMALLGIYLTGTMPFKEVFCHAMVRDPHGRKMGKSLGNGVDPLDIVYGLSLEAMQAKLEQTLDRTQIAKVKAVQKKEFPNGIPQCGADALRFALCAYSGGCTFFFNPLCRCNSHSPSSSAGRDINLDILRVEGYRKFCA